MLLLLWLKIQTLGYAQTKNANKEFSISNKVCHQLVQAAKRYTVENASTLNIQAHATKVNLTFSKKICIFNNAQNARTLYKKAWAAIILNVVVGINFVTIVDRNG